MYNRIKKYLLTNTKMKKNKLKNKLKKDTKELAKMNFDDLPTEKDWLKLQKKSWNKFS